MRENLSSTHLLEDLSGGVALSGHDPGALGVDRTNTGAAPEYGVVFVVGLQDVVLGLEGYQGHRAVLDLESALLGLGRGLPDLTLEHSLVATGLQ